MTANMKAGLEQAGVKWGQGFTWAPADNVVEAATHCAVGDDVDGESHSMQCEAVLTRYGTGRSFAIMPEGYYDLQDDLDKGYGGNTLLELITKRMEAGDQLA